MTTSGGGGDPRRTPPAAERLPPRGLIAPLLLGLVAVAGLLWLGTWQIERRRWKLDLIARVERHLHAAPVSAPAPADWGKLSANDVYRRVRVRGRFLHDRETLVRAVTARGGGYWVLTPLQADGYVVLVNRGFVPEERAEPRARSAGQRAGPVEITGLLRLSEPRGAFLRSNDPAHDRWYSRDVPAIASSRRLMRAAPYFVDADAAPNPGGYPAGGMTVIAFANNHLAYALTWYGLALSTAGALVLLVRMRRGDRNG